MERVVKKRKDKKRNKLGIINKKKYKKINTHLTRKKNP